LKNLLSILLILFSLNAVSQYVVSQSIWEHGPAVSFDWSYRHLLSNVDSYGVNQLIIDGRNEREKYAPRLTVGWNLGIKKGPFSFGTGVFYSMKGHRGKDTLVFAVMPPEIQYGLYKNQTYYHYVDIPLHIAVKFRISDRHYLKTQLGYINNLYLISSGRTKWKMLDDDSEWNKSSGFESELSRYSAQLSAGLYLHWYPLNIQVPYEFGPEFKFGLFPIKDTPIHQRNYSIGLRFAMFL